MTRQQLAMLVDDLPEEQIDIAGTCLLYLRDQCSQEECWAAPEFQAFIKRRIEESLEEEGRGDYVTQEKARALFSQWRAESTG